MPIGAEFRVLATFCEESTLSDITSDLDRSLRYVAELNTRIIAKNLVYTFRSGKNESSLSLGHAANSNLRYFHR